MKRTLQVMLDSILDPTWGTVNFTCHGQGISVLDLQAANVVQCE